MSPTWKNRIVGYGAVDPQTLKPNLRNWRQHPDNQKAALTTVLEQVGIVQNVIVNKVTGLLVDGHLRLDLALRHKQPSIAVTYVELSEAEEAAVLATIDPLSSLATTNVDKLGELLGEFVLRGSEVNDMLDALMGNDSSLETGLDDIEPATDNAPAEVEETLWPTITVRVPPTTLTLYQSIQEMLRGQDESTKFVDLINRAASTL